MGSMFGDNTHTKVFVSLVLIGTIFSACASILMLILIRRLKKWNGHLLLVTTMTVFTLVYDVTFFPGIINLGNKYATIFSNCCQLFSGTASSLTSNVIAFITFYVVSWRRRVDIFKNYFKILWFIIIPSVIDCIIFLSSLQGPDSQQLADIAILYIYYYLKLISIAVNFLLFTLTYLEIRRIASGKRLLSQHEQALNALSMRLFWYPIVQSISRSGCAWYELAYTYDRHASNGFDLDPAETNNTQFAAQIVMALTMPIGSIGYLVIFLIMQPKAYQELKALCGLLPIEEQDKNLEDSLNELNFSTEVSHSDLRQFPIESPRESFQSYESESHLRFSLLQSVDEERSSTWTQT